jgi:precorrin-3B C17-methyltransferase
LEAAAQGDFVIALYNPASHSRPHQLGDAFALLRRWKDANTPVVLARAVGSDQARLTVTTLADRAALQADMRTIVLIGASTTRLIAREGAAPWVYTPRSERAPI